MRRVFLLLLVAVIPAPAFGGPITYTLRDAHFFGGTPGPTREIIATGPFTPASNVSHPYTFSTGGGTSVVFNGVATNQGSPLELTVSNLVEAGQSAALAANNSPFDPISIVSIVSSGLQENGLVVTGSSGTGYLLPTFRVDGAFEDAHANAFANLGICAGISSCTLSGLGASTGGAQAVDQLFTPLVSAGTAFTFGVPFNFFFFVTTGVQSFGNTLAAGGDVGGDFRLRLLGYKIVDVNGNEIADVSVTSDLLNPVPEPATLLVVAGGLAAALARRHGRRREGQA